MISDKQLNCVKWFDDVSTSPGYMIIHSASSSTPDGVTPKPGSILRMRLIGRQQMSNLTLPRCKTWPSNLVPPFEAPFHFLPNVYRFARFLLATPNHILENLSGDLEGLEAERRLLSAHADELGLTFVTSTEGKVRRQMEKATTEDRAFDGRHCSYEARSRRSRNSTCKTRTAHSQPAPSDALPSAPALETFLAATQQIPICPAESNFHGFVTSPQGDIR